MMRMRRTDPALTPATRTDAPAIRPPAFSKLAVREYWRVKSCERWPRTRMIRMMIDAAGDHEEAGPDEL